VIADNKLALNAEWDLEMLKVELSDLELSGFDISITGFDDAEMLDLLGDGIEQGDVIEDAGDSDFSPAITSYGEVWALGRHRLMCGDSSNIGDIDSLLNGINPDILMYDPPYEMEDAWTWFYPAKKTLVFSDFKHVKRAMSIANNYEHVYQFVWDNCTSWYTPNRPLARHKTSFFCCNDPFWNFDAAIYQDGKERKAKTVSNTRGESDYKPLDDGFVHLQTVYQEPNTKQDNSHAHAKPVKWLNALIRGCGAGVMLDLFGGSGASIIAAPGNVDVYCMEIDAKSCDKIIDRWQKSTGETAVLATPSS
jgi:DNA modification methylase